MNAYLSVIYFYLSRQISYYEMKNNILITLKSTKYHVNLVDFDEFLFGALFKFYVGNIGCHLNFVCVYEKSLENNFLKWLYCKRWVSTKIFSKSKKFK